MSAGKKWRWRVAHWLNRSDRFCWADLVTWALGWETTLVDARSRSCGSDADFQRTGACYCGKFRRSDDAS